MGKARARRESRSFCFLGREKRGPVLELRPVIHIPIPRRKLARWNVERGNRISQTRGMETHWCEVAGGAQWASVMPQRNGEAQGIPQGTPAASSVRAKKQKQSNNTVRSAGESSAATARTAGHAGTIRQKIIGRRIAGGAGGLWLGRVLQGKDRTLTLFDQPTRKHGGGVFLEPLIEQFGNLLAEIGGVSESRELIRLQSVARGRKEKFPGSLGAELRQGCLPENGLQKYRSNINARVITNASTFRVTRLWKAVEKTGSLQGLCSGCAGDYEDPDRSAWEADGEDEDGDTRAGKGPVEGEGDEKK